MIYFDNNATTPISEDVRQAMMPYLTEAYGNPNSIHEAGNRTRVAIEKARNQVARAIGATASEITFTGSGSESNNHAILGVLQAHWKKERSAAGKNLVISAIEHPSVKATAEWAAKMFGYELRIARFATKDGIVDLAPFEEAIDDATILVSTMVANNETGTLLPVAEIFELARAKGALCHCDGVQALGKIKVNVAELGCDLFSMAAHKLHGPKGVGALFTRRGVKIEVLVHGGAQESGRRAGTENVAYIAGAGVAAEQAAAVDLAAIAAIRDHFESKLRERFDKAIHINFADLPRTPNVSSVQFKGQDGNLLLIKLDRKELCASTGSACSSGSLSVSGTLLAMGLTEAQARATLRFSLSKFTTEAEVAEAIDRIAEVFKPGRR
ncbi:Cysteine desulfurase [Sulfidibacter corallicola]|uniref:cysteine desulfurase n=1 Tax=Sulfidibacter corallicola TaxID=2818388 RepID=A0A8A4TT64_SULCO|nr:cysteine desulfurase family protein [Sulfidibacter corallicola]QTD53149.1 cysteine desulfurase [Sulfidibacter corallicola]